MFHSRLGGRSSLLVIGFLITMATVDFFVAISSQSNVLVVLGGFLCAFLAGFRISEYLTEKEV